MRLNAKLAFDGNCEAAFKLYEQCLRAKITFMQSYGAASLASAGEELFDRIVHATLQTANGFLTGADVPSAEYKKPQGFSLQLNVAPEEDVQQIYNVLSKGGEVLFPLQKTFWSEQYAVVTDRFGVSWEINAT